MFRLGLYVRCLRSERGQEPREPYLLDPATHAIRYRKSMTAAEYYDAMSRFDTGYIDDALPAPVREGANTSTSSDRDANGNALARPPPRPSPTADFTGRPPSRIQRAAEEAAREPSPLLNRARRDT
jgi:hypothetical protein